VRACAQFGYRTVLTVQLPIHPNAPKASQLMLLADPLKTDVAHAGSSAAAPAGYVGLRRLTARGAAGPDIPLPLGKSTLGSGARCTIRVQQPGVQPIHCIFQRSAGRSIAPGFRSAID
jgi:hypothetical protein